MSSPAFNEQPRKSREPRNVSSDDVGKVISSDEDMRRRSPLRRESFSFLGVDLPGNVAGLRCEEVPRGDQNYSHFAFSCLAVIEPREVRR